MPLDHVGEAEGYQIYRNADGYLEGYKHIGDVSSPTSKPNAGQDRVITNAKTIGDFIKWVKGRRPLFSPKPSDQPELPFE